MSKRVYLVLSILEVSKTVMYEFRYDYVKQKYRQSKTALHGYRQLYSLDKNTYVYIAKDVEKRFDTSSYELVRLLLREKKKIMD